MKESVSLKSYPNGIKIYMDDSIPFDLILEQVSLKFKDSEKFFGNARLALLLEGRVLSQDQEKQLIDCITSACSLDIVCMVGRNKGEEQFFTNAVSSMQYLTPDQTAQFYRGSLKNKQILETDHSIIVIGDVNSGCSIISKKDIIILGGLYGSAYAGIEGEHHFIAALKMDPESIRIGDYRGKHKRKGTGLFKEKPIPQIAYIKDENLFFDRLEVTEELLKHII